MRILRIDTSKLFFVGGYAINRACLHAMGGSDEFTERSIRSAYDVNGRFTVDAGIAAIWITVGR